MESNATSPHTDTYQVKFVKVLKTRYLRHITKFSINTQKLYGNVLNKFIEAVPDNICDICPEHIERFILSLPVGTNTKNTYLSCIRSFYNWLELNYDVKNIGRRVQPLKPVPPKQRILTEQEYQKLLECCCDRDVNILKFLANTGLRVTEFLELKPENISDGFIEVVNSKGNKSRFIPSNKTIKSLIFSNIYFPKNCKYMQRLCLRCSEQAGIERFSPHSLRHYFATTLYKKKVRVSIISKLLGHTNSAITEMCYIHAWSKIDLEGVTNVLD